MLTLKSFILALSITWFALPCCAQNIIGIPEVINYTKSVYGAGTENRGIVQDKNGVMYFANYEGLLSFDGVYWKIYPLPNKTIVRSIAIGKDNRIYAGGQNDFGYFSPDANGKLAYTSLKNLLSEKNFSFSDIWFTCAFGNDVFFMSRERIFQLTNKTVTVFQAAADWLFLGNNKDELIAQDSKNGLLAFREGVWKPFLKKSSLPGKFLATCIFPFGKDSSFIGTVNTGFYVLNNDTISSFHFKSANPVLSERVLTAIPVNNELLAIGTTLNGVYVVNKNGEIIQNLSRKEGLQNNNILKLFLDKSNNLWLGQDNGIDFIAYNNSLKHIYPEQLNEGLGYTSVIYNNYIYVGTSNGLYCLPYKQKQDLSFLTGDFKYIPGTKGSTFGLTEVNGQLLLGHHDGAFQVIGDKVIPLDTTTTFWTFAPFSNVLPSTLVVAGNDIGLNLLKFENNKFTVTGNVAGYNASSQFLAIDNNHSIWVAHPYRGVYKIDLNDPQHAVVKQYTEKNGLPSHMKNHLFKVKNHIVVTTEKGVYEYNAQTDNFEPSAYFKPLFGERYIRHLKEDASGNIWFIENNDLGVIDFSGSQPETIYFPEMSGKMVADLEHIYPYNKYNVFIGVEKGFYHINYEDYKKNSYPVQVKIRSVRIFGKTDSLLYGGYFGEVDETKDQPASFINNINNKWNSVHLEFTSPLYVAQNSVKYSYQLVGYDKDWSAWSKKTEKEYTNLAAGKYTFLVKAKSNHGNESEVSNYSFTILPPWYFTTLAFFIYGIVFIGFNYLFFKWLRIKFLQQQKKHQEEQARLQYLHQLELEKSEKEIVKLKNEKLEAEISHKNKELASAAMHLLQKGELLGNVREEIIKLKKVPNGEGSPEELKKMLKILNEENKMDKDWEQFAVHFDNVHSDFLKILKSVYQNLSAHELKLSAYLRMNLSSKEIAQLENISVRGVEISRYRLRKKLKIPTDINLFDFLIEVHTTGKLYKGKTVQH